MGSVISSRAYADFSPIVLACFSQALLLASIFIVSLGITVPPVGELPLTHIFV